MPFKQQKTLGKPFFLEGTGLFTGSFSSVHVIPAPAGTGIVFKRTDLPGSPSMAADVLHAQASVRCTRIGDSQASVQTVEHLLSALHAYQISNALIEISGPEVPIFDGSALVFAQNIEKSGIHTQEEERPLYRLTQPVFFSHGETHLIALPDTELRISYTLHYPQSAFLRSQFYSIAIDASSFLQEIAPCRTFSLYEEIAPFIESGVIKGGSLENAVIIKEDKVMNDGGLRFPDEPVRHKVLDLLGDLTLINRSFTGHIIAIRSGHHSNIAFAKEILKQLERS